MVNSVKPNELPGKPEWAEMLIYVAALHRRSVHPPVWPFPHEWEEIGPGYVYAPAFGHWDILHALLDTLPYDPAHTKRQMENYLTPQADGGFLPGAMYIKEGAMTWGPTHTHPPLWPFVVDGYTEITGDASLRNACVEPLRGQIAWFETNRRSEDGVGFFYCDIRDRLWESGVDEGVRFDDAPQGPFACVDATAHLYLCYDALSRWAGDDRAAQKAAKIKDFLQTRLWGEETGFFYDTWAVRDAARRTAAFEGFFPFVVGAATDEQAQRVIEDNLLNPERFFASHPIRTVGRDDPRREGRMWRGPAWNSMTYWAARGCLRYNRPDAAKILVEAALDNSMRWFVETKTIWEFYDADGGDPRQLQRKPHTPFNAPSHDYLGHNPLLAMARIWEENQ